MSVIFKDLSTPGKQFAVSSSRLDNAVGIVLPIGKATDGVFFKQSYTTLEQAKSNIKNLILTTRGERLMHPTLGSGLWNLIFEPMQGDDFAEQVKTTIRENVNIWLPYISLDRLVVTVNNENNSVVIGMDISLKNDPQTKDTIYFSISTGDL